MGTAEDLMQRLAVSKKIMERSEQIKSVDTRKINTPMVEEFESVNTTYNLPPELMSEQTQQKPLHDPSKPLDENRILSSKLPDEIKRLMIEQPIVQPGSMNGSVSISDEVIQGAQRLMNMGIDKTTPKPTQRVNEVIDATPPSKSNINVSEIKNMIRDVVRDTVRDVIREELKEAGMLVESTTNSNEVLQFKVGNHLFVGKVTKVKKLEK
jgi:hypothetical protein